MTSGPTRRDTVKFFEQHQFFGLDPKHVIFFEQGTLPCFSNDGKILLETDRQLAAAPDGNGGVYAALLKEGVLADMARRGIEHIHTYCVDNCLVRVADPVFIGFSISKGADCGAKVVPKEAPEEPVGIVCRRNGRFRVVEYSEIDVETTKLRDPSGRLLFRAANIANHYYTRRFLERVVRDIEPCLAYHIAKKKIPFYDTTTHQTVKPTQPNGIKLELFVFDVLPFTQRVAVLEVPRADEFAPLKNAPGAGVDCPETSRDALQLQHCRFLEAVGAHIDKSGSGVPDVEISGRVSYAGEALFPLHGVHLQPPIRIESVQDIERLSKK